MALGDEAQRRLAEGQSVEQVARWSHQARRDLGIMFKEMTPKKLLDYIYTRNIEKYGDPLGPSIEWLRNVGGKTWEDIIESATRPGGEDIIPLLKKLLEE